MRYLILLLTIFASPLIAQQSALNQLIKTWEDHESPRGPGGFWEQWTPEEEASERSFLQGMVQDLAQVPALELGQQERINYRLLAFIVAHEYETFTFGTHQFPLNAEGGFLTDVVYSVYGTRCNSPQEVAAYLGKLSALPEFFNWQERQMRAGMKAGKMSPQLIVDNCLGMIKRQLDAPLEETLFMGPVGDDPEVRGKVSEVVEQLVLPAYSRLHDFLAKEYRPAAPVAVGVSGITDGKAHYEERVRYYTTFDVSPKEVFETGQREVARIRAEMEEIIKELGFEGNFADFLNFLRTDPQFYAETPEEILKEGAWIVKRMEAKLPQYFGHLPRMPLAVTPVPDALAPNYTGGRYSPGNYRTGKPGEFWINTYNLPSRPLYVLPALALHEGAPGHHTQIMLSAEMDNVPDFRSSLYLSAFGEGWALYTEFLGKEAGIYRTPYEDFGRLTYEMWRACRLVVDPGMHYMGWSREQAVAFLQENTALSIHEVNTEIDRYIGWPGQAVSYKMGELKIRQLRKEAEERLGDKFDLRAFHDLILVNGSVTMDLLEELVDTFIKETLDREE